VRDWIELCQHSKKEKTVMVLVGNKADLQPQRAVKSQEASKFAEAHSMHYFETSAKTNYNISEIFAYASETYINLTFTEEVTIGNLENICNNYAKEVGAKASAKEAPPSIELNAKLAGGGQQKNKSGGCC
jgi:GTPase SAR1 family protein